MSTITERKELILAEERKLASLIAVRLIEKPKLSWWMILIPIIFVFFFQKLDKVVKGREQFAANYMIIPVKVLDMVCDAIEKGSQPETDMFCRRLTLPKGAEEQFKKRVEVLADYYGDLLKAEGKDFTGLARTAFDNKERFLLTMQHLCDVEREYNEALSPDLMGNVPEARELTQNMMIHNRALRMEMVQEVFR